MRGDFDKAKRLQLKDKIENIENTMSEPHNNLKIGRFSLHDVELITRARLLEESPTLSWESSDANRATRQADLAVGEEADAATFLVARARIVEKTVVAKNPAVKPFPVQLTPPTWINAALIGVAFIVGLLTDQLASTDSRINLLSLPFFGVLLWNILVYLMLLISGFKRGGERDFLGLRKLLSFVEYNAAAKRLRKTKTLTSLMQPFSKHYAAAAFHMAALFFVLGMIASVLLRGVGTAYVVGWESTWFASSPEIVYQIIAITYGICTNFLGPMPNILEVANMRFDRLAISGVDASAGLWLMRMIVMLALFVVIPRFFLAFKHWLQIRKLKSNYPLDLSERYYGDILRAWRAEAVSLDLLIPQTLDDQKSIESAYRFAEALGFNLAEVKNHRWSVETDDIPLTLEARNQGQQVWALMNATTTPEHEVQGISLEKVTEKMGKTPVILLVDMAAYMARFGDFADRIESRKELWTNFAKSCKLPVVFYHSGLKPDDKTCEELKLACVHAD